MVGDRLFYYMGGPTYQLGPAAARVDLERWAGLLRATEAELAAAEDTPGDPRALERLLADLRARACLAELRTVLAALDRGEPLRGTGELLRQAADAFEGPRQRRRAAA